MRSVIIGASLILVFVFASLIGITLTDETQRCDEIEASLEDSIKESLEEMHRVKSYPIENINDFMADFCETLLYENSANGKLTVSLLGYDNEKGIADIEVKSQFKIVTGKTKEIKREIAVDLERW